MAVVTWHWGRSSWQRPWRGRWLMGSRCQQSHSPPSSQGPSCGAVGRRHPTLMASTVCAPPIPSAAARNARPDMLPRSQRAPSATSRWPSGRGGRTRTVAAPPWLAHPNSSMDVSAVPLLLRTVLNLASITRILFLQSVGLPVPANGGFDPVPMPPPRPCMCCPSLTVPDRPAAVPAVACLRPPPIPVPSARRQSEPLRAVHLRAGTCRCRAHA